LVSKEDLIKAKVHALELKIKNFLNFKNSTSFFDEHITYLDKNVTTVPNFGTNNIYFYAFPSFGPLFLIDFLGFIYIYIYLNLCIFFIL
jgi:hypothetical protein